MDGEALPIITYLARLGEILHGRYIVRVKLGGGMFSTVYLVEDNVPNDRYVLQHTQSRINNLIPSVSLS